jgi:hypothetical protein
MAHPKPSRLGPLPGSMTVSPLPAPRLTVREAAERLDESGLPFTFFIDAATAVVASCSTATTATTACSSSRRGADTG